MAMQELQLLLLRGQSFLHFSCSCKRRCERGCLLSELRISLVQLRLKRIDAATGYHEFTKEIRLVSLNLWRNVPIESLPLHLRRL
jgi:hypothetical protein